MRDLTLGSLFSGSGGFELAGIISGIKPVWNSEIEPFPIRVEECRFPDVLQLGDVSKIDGHLIPPVDIITFGSPCQDMSIAGSRSGLCGPKSSLFYEAIRIIKEMREATNGEYPKYAVWENVKGALSSNKRRDFREVLQEFIKIKDAEAYVPQPTKWEHAGTIMGDTYSIAWRLFNAKFWGVPQRRERIYLVADFAGHSAGKILFESEGMSGYSKQMCKTRQETAGRFGICVDTAGSNLALFENHMRDSRYNKVDVCPTLTSMLGTGGNNQPLVVEKNKHIYHSSTGDYHMRFSDVDVADTLLATDYKSPQVLIEEPYYIARRLTPIECARLQGFPDWWCDNLHSHEPTDEEIEKYTAIFETYRQAINKDMKPKTRNQIIRFLKKPYSDTAAYKMWGNGIALPNAIFVLSGIVSNVSRET